MKVYLIYFIDHKTGNSVIIKDQYRTLDDSTKNLERVACEYVREMQGKQQFDVCKQNKTMAQLLNDNFVREGMYIECIGNVIVLYEKVQVVVTGTLWNTKVLDVIKIGTFGVTEFVVDEAIANQGQCNCIASRAQPVAKSVTKTLTDEGKLEGSEPAPSAATMLNQLKSIIAENGGTFKLRPVSERKLRPKVTDKGNVPKKNQNYDHCATIGQPAPVILDMFLDDN